MNILHVQRVQNQIKSIIEALDLFLMSFELSNKIRQTLELILTQWSSYHVFYMIDVWEIQMRNSFATWDIDAADFTGVWTNMQEKILVILMALSDL